MPRARKKRRKPAPRQRISGPGRRPPSIAEMPSVSEIDPQSSCPPPPPGYSGDWYSNCLQILGIR